MYFKINDFMTPQEIRRLRTLGNRLGGLIEDRDSQPIQPTDVFEPALNIYEMPNAYIFAFELVGIKKDKISLNVEDGFLYLKTDTIEFFVPENAELVHQEIKANRYERHLRLPEKVKLDGIQAEYKSGILYVFVPKLAEEKRESIQIQID